MTKQIPKIIVLVVLLAVSLVSYQRYQRPKLGIVTTKTVGGQENTAVEAFTTQVTLNNTTPTTIVESLNGESNHIKIYVDNPSTKDVIIKFQAAGVDSLQAGMTIPRGTGKTILELPNVYRGEISAIAVIDSPVITIIRQ